MSPILKMTPLRESYERARSLDRAEQIRECIDRLENPEVLIAEFMASFTAIESCIHQDEPLPDEADEEELCLELFPPGCEVEVSAAVPYRYRTVATQLAPLSLSGDSKSTAIDYLALTRDQPEIAALGAVQSALDATPYTLLLRLLSFLAEIAPEAQIARLNRDRLKGALGERPVFDLHLVLDDAGDERDAATLRQLTHDVAESIQRAILSQGPFPNVLGNVLCLRVPSAGFQGALELDWKT